MKKTILFFLGLTLCACHRNADTLIGTWIADKVNVQFDEKRSTPELVKQIGEMEKQNVITITADSLLTFKGLDDSFQGRINLESNGTLYCKGAVFGIWKDRQIVTRTNSPLGEIVVVYRKE